MYAAALDGSSLGGQVVALAVGFDCAAQVEAIRSSLREKLAAFGAARVSRTPRGWQVAGWVGVAREKE